MSIHSAVEQGDIKKVKHILSKEGVQTSLDSRNRYGYLPLHLAVREGRQDVARLLLDKGADVHARTLVALKSPLYIAAATSNMFFVDLLDPGQLEVAVKATDIYGYTPLHAAIRKGSSRSVMELINKGADMEAADMYGRTALHYAVRKGRRNNVTCLLSRGADVFTRDLKDNTVLHSVEEESMYDLLNLHLHDFWQEDNDQENCDGKTPLHLAVERDQLYMVTDMCERGANPVQEDNYGHTPLDLARAGEHEEILQWLEQFARGYSSRSYFERRRGG